MNFKKTISAIAFSLLGLLGLNNISAKEKEARSVPSDKLVVVWTSDDPNVAERVALMYTHAAKVNKWFTDVTLVIWGPSAKLISEDIRLQEKLSKMQADGIIIEACIACAKSYAVVDKLQQLGYTVKPMGLPLTEYMKEGRHVLTF